MLSNYTGCDCDINTVLDISNKNRGITIKDGYGVSNCNIDNDSKLRVGNLERHYKSKQQLFPRPHLTSPFISKATDISLEGSYDVLHDKSSNK